MQIYFNLVDRGRARTSVRVIVSHRGKYIRRSTGIPVLTRDWSQKRQRTGNVRLDGRLKEIRIALESRLSPLSTMDEARAAVDDVLGGVTGTPGESAMWGYAEAWSRGNRYRELACRKVREAMGDACDFRDVDRAWCARLLDRLEGQGLSANYTSSIVARFKTCLKSARDRGVTDCDGYTCMKARWTTADSTYLTGDEVDALAAAPLSGRDAMARDLFVLGIFTAARFQTYSRLTSANIHGGFIEFVQPKTGGRVILPASPRVTEVLARYGGSAPSMTEQELNRRLKAICGGLGMTETVEVAVTRGGRRTVEKRRRCDMVSSHTARRTGATLLYLSGIPMRQCMMLTGHTTEANFMKYIRVTKEQNARMLADNPFFK